MRGWCIGGDPIIPEYHTVLVGGDPIMREYHISAGWCWLVLAGGAAVLSRWRWRWLALALALAGAALSLGNPIIYPNKKTHKI
jgi:hypothetical protein